MSAVSSPKNKQDMKTLELEKQLPSTTANEVHQKLTCVIVEVVVVVISCIIVWGIQENINTIELNLLQLRFKIWGMNLWLETLDVKLTFHKINIYERQSIRVS